MVTIRVHEFLDKEENEVVLEIISGYEKVYAYCYPYTGLQQAENVTLDALFAYNVGPSERQYPTKVLSDSHFRQRICAEIVSAKERTVKIGDIHIVLDTDIDSSWPEGSLIVFDVQRLDL